MKENNFSEENDFKFLYQIPYKNERHISLVIQTTGLSKENNIIEIGSCEIINGMTTCNSFQVQIKPRYDMSIDVIQKNKKENDFYDSVKDIFPSEKKNLENFIEWVNGSKIFCHNAPFVMKELEQEFSFCGLKPIPKEQFRCTLRIFREIISVILPSFNRKDVGLINCCNHFGINVEEHDIDDSS